MRSILRFGAVIAIGVALTAAAICLQGASKSETNRQTSSRAASAASTHAGSEAAARRGLGVRAEGRLVARPGAEVWVGTEVKGLVESVPVEEDSPVAKGQLLLKLRSSEPEAALREAKARVTEAESEARYFAHEEARKAQLFADHVVTGEVLDAARHEKETAAARHESAVATVARLSAALDKTVVRAPIRGVVLRRNVQPGEMVDSDAPLFRIVDLEQVRIEAEVDEFDIRQVSVGAPVQVTCEGFEGQQWTGRVESVPESVGSRTMRPQDPGKPTDAGVLLVKIALSGPTPLKLGQRVEVEIGGTE